MIVYLVIDYQEQFLTSIHSWESIDFIIINFVFSVSVDMHESYMFSHDPIYSKRVTIDQKYYLVDKYICIVKI